MSDPTRFSLYGNDISTGLFFRNEQKPEVVILAVCVRSTFWVFQKLLHACCTLKSVLEGGRRKLVRVTLLMACAVQHTGQRIFCVGGRSYINTK